MNRFKNIFKRDEQAQGQSGQQQLPGRTATGGPAMNNGAVNGQADSDSQGDTEGFLCPTCMQSFPTPDGLQQHFAVAHAEPPSQVSADKELELLKMQLTASEESRSLLSSELINMQKQMQQLAAEQPDTPDLSGEVKRLETQIELMQIENTELVEKGQLADKSIQQLQEALTAALQEQKTLNTTLTAEKEKYNLISEQVAQEKQRNVSVQEESKRLSEQLRKSEVAMEQLKIAASKADEMVAKVAGKEELCRNLEQQINDYKQNSIKHESEIGQLKRSLETKEESIKRSAAMHEEMKTAMESKIHSMEALIQEKTTSLDRVLADNEQLQHKMQTVEGRLNDNQAELLEANKKYDDLHQNFVQRIDAGEGTNVIVTQLKEDNARVQEKLKHTEEKLQQEKEESYQKLKSAEASQKELEQRLTKLTTEMEQLKVDLVSIQTKNTSLQSDHSLQLSTLTSEHESTVADLEEAISSLKLSQQETTEKFEQELSTQKEQNTQLTSSLQEHVQELSSLRLQIEQLKENLSHLTNENESLNQEVSNQKEKVSEAAADNENVSRQLAEKLAEVSQLNELTERLSKQQQEMSEDNAAQTETLTERIKTLEDDLKSSEDLLQEKLSALDQLHEDSAVLNETILEVKENLASSEGEKRRLEAENISMQALVTNLEMEKLSLNRETDRLQGESNSTSAQLISLSAELNQSRELLQQKEVSIQTLKQQIDSQTKEGEILQSSLLEQIDQMQKEARKQAEEKKTEISGLNGDIDELRNKVKKQSETNAALSQEHAAALDKLNTAEAQLASLQVTCEESRKEVELVMQQMDKKADDHSHILQETTEILQRTSDENEALTRALTELKTERSVIEEQLLNAQKNSDEWQSKHRLLQDDIEAVKHALLQEKTTSEETKQLLISNKLQMQGQLKTLEEEKDKVTRELEEAAAARDVAEEKAQDNLRILEAALAAEKSKMEEAEAKYNMQLVSLTENLSLNKTDLTATQEKLMDVVKHNDELRGFNIELETKLEASNDERNMLWNRCMSSESETKALRDENEQLKTKIENLNSALYELGRENQSLQIKTTKAQARRWVEDEDVPDCTNCTRSFNVRVRRHHCRNCGNIFCHDCSSKQLQLPISSKPSRVCDSCYTELNR